CASSAPVVHLHAGTATTQLTATTTTTVLHLTAGTTTTTTRATTPTTKPPYSIKGQRTARGSFSGGHGTCTGFPAQFAANGYVFSTPTPGQLRLQQPDGAVDQGPV